jgi:hypothetical protein
MFKDKLFSQGSQVLTADTKPYIFLKTNSKNRESRTQEDIGPKYNNSFLFLFFVDPVEQGEKGGGKVPCLVNSTHSMNLCLQKFPICNEIVEAHSKLIIYSKSL